MSIHAISKQAIVLLCATVFIEFFAIDNKTQRVNVVNDTNISMKIDVIVPARTEAIIMMKKLHEQNAQDMLHKAILSNSAEDVRKAVLAGANIDNGKDGKSPLLWALLLQRHDAFEELIKLGSNVKVTYEGVSLVLHASRLGDLKSAVLLIKKGVNISGQWIGSNISILERIYLDFMDKYKSDEANTLELVQELINHGFDANRFLVDGFIYTCNQLIPEIIKLCIKWEADPNYVMQSQGSTPLLSAIKKDNIKAVATLLEVGADANQEVTCTTNGIVAAPLLLAIDQSNAIAIMDVLLKHGANPNRVTKDGWGRLTTPLAKAIVNKNIKAIEILLQAGTDVNQKACIDLINGEQKPLSIAIVKGDAEIIKLLLDHGASL
jgi:ankyrin repeat protein